MKMGRVKYEDCKFAGKMISYYMAPSFYQPTFSDFIILSDKTFSENMLKDNMSNVI
jgi:hypothetical protein